MRDDQVAISGEDDLGKRGESMARDYLLQCGYRILDTNWHYGHKEIDIVALHGREIVVVEVKTREENFAVEPWESVTPSKIRNIVEVTDAWLRMNREERETRFDVISIVMEKTGGHTLEHFEGAFIPPVNQGR